jgi:S-(hydroxymethyl)glutathione dehydrogenase / alcohol dehydrogenase
MKALVVNAVGGGFDFEDVDIAAPLGREVLVDVRSLSATLTSSSPPTLPLGSLPTLRISQWSSGG